MLDIFKLHQPEDNRSDRCWILAKGKDLRKQIDSLQYELLRDLSRSDLVNSLAEKIGINLRIELNTESVGEWLAQIKELRKSHGISIRKLLRTTNLWINIPKIERGEILPRCRTLKKLDKTLKLRVKQVCNKDDFCLCFLNLLCTSLNSNSEWIPLAVISSLLDIYKEKLRIDHQEFLKIKNNIISSIEYLKINNNSSKPIKAVKEIDEYLAKIIGAFAADGNFATYRMIRWEDEYKGNLKVLSSWFEKIFCIRLKIEPTKRDRNSFLTQLTNKLICRYLEVFFNFHHGDKRYTVDEPILIKQEPLKIRKAFASGALMFDGSVNFDGSVSFSSTSKKFRDSVARILLKDKISLSISSKPLIRPNRAPKWEFVTVKMSNESSIKKLTTYFEEGTKKWKILNFYLNGFSGSDIESYLLKLLPKNSVIRSINFIKMAKELGKFNVYDLIKITNLSRTALNKYLHLFEVADVLSSKIEDRKRVYYFNIESDTLAGSYSVKSP